MNTLYWDYDANSPVSMVYLVIENDKGEELKYPISPEQLKAIIYILGLDFKATGSTGQVSSLSDKSLADFINRIKSKFDIVINKSTDEL